MKSRSLVISCWNIQGLRSSAFGLKSRTTDFIRELKDSDIIILQETWNRGDMPTGCPLGYREVIFPSTKLKSVNQGRDSGGMLIWYKTNLTHSIELIKKGDFSIWFKIKKEVVSTGKDLFMCTAYIPPSESPYYNQNTFSILEDEISFYQTQGNVLICGDLNARTGTEPDLINAQGDKHIPGQINTPPPSHRHRNNFDKTVNKNGHQLLQLCRTLGLYIVNGRLRGDSFGLYTHSSPLGNSTVDYSITDLEPFCLRAFTVSPLTPLSDHSKITLYIRKTPTHPHVAEPSKLNRSKQPYRWTNNSKDEYQKAIAHPAIQSQLDHFLSTSYPHSIDGINQAVQDMNYIFDITADLSNLKKSQHHSSNQPTNEKWFDSDCRRLRRTLRKLSNQKHRQPDDHELRLQYWETLKLYRTTLRAKKKQHEQHQLEEIEESIDSNNFWRKWHSFNKPHKEELAIQNGDIWKKHFENLYSAITLDPSQNNLLNKLETLESVVKDNQSPLDYEMSDRELLAKIQALQPRKASGPDGILNEMLQFSSHKIKTAILKLFNLILNTGHFPDTWSQGIITPIFKNGNKYEPNNYRGICVSSNLGKLFCSILNSRLQNFLSEHDVLSKSQIGFTPQHRTTDHIYTLHTLIQKHVHQNKNTVFSCFVDFKKAFDSIWHHGLFLKLLQKGIGGKIYDIIKTMYTINKCAVKIGNMETDFFPQSRGVKQGCSLSPTLFNIYIDDLAKSLEESDIPGLTLSDTQVKCLLFADDLILLAPSKEALRQQLDHLQSFCQTWALTVNLEKTKVMVFQKRPKCQKNQHRFLLDSTDIEHTHSYT